MSEQLRLAEACRDLVREKREAMRACHRSIDDLYEQIKMIQEKECPHPETEYVPDASGNNDDWDKCLYCGGAA
jgi:hypothetical protein